MSGIIYLITNQVNGKTYVGKTSKSIEARFKSHKFNAIKRSLNTYLYKSIRKYGIENFTIESIEEVPLDLLNEREIFWIANLSPAYNMTKGGDGGDMSSSPNFKKSMILSHQNRSPDQYATYGMLGKKQSQKFINAIKKSNCCPVICEGVQYSSVLEAQEAHPGISIRKRLDNPKYPNFYRLRERTKRSRFN